MSEITLVGLGAMGSAIARTLLENGCELTVWNRTDARVKDLAALGARAADSLRQAVEASPRLLVCIHGYANTRSLLDDPEIVPLLSGRTVIQLSTGTPAEAREAEAWVDRHGGNYLDGSIMVYPPSIGREDGQLLIAGRREAWDDCAALIGLLGGDVRYLGSAIGAAAALDIAILARLVAKTVSIVYGIHICESEGVPLDEYAGMFAETDRARHLTRVIGNNNFKDDIASTVGTSMEAAKAIRELAIESGINSEFPDFMLGLYQRAAAAGQLELDSASVIEVFRGNA